MRGETIEDLFARYGPSYRLFVTVGAMLASFIMVLSGTIVNVAVPEVMGAFGVGQDKAQLMATGFIATMTASQLVNAWLVTAFGPRITFIFVLLVFVAGSLLGGLSSNLDIIIVGRIMQGFSAGVIQPLAMVTVVQVFPANRRGVAVGIFGMGLMLAVGAGPLIGGIAIDAFSWRAIFWVPLPLVGLALVLGAIFMPSARKVDADRSFDWTSYSLLCLALYCIIAGISNGQREGWTSDGILLRLFIGIAAVTVFVRLQLRDGPRLLDFTLFKNARFTSAVVVGFVFGMGNFAMTYAIPVFSQLVQGYTPSQAGLLLLPAALVLVVLFPISGRLSDHVPAQFPIMGGLLLFALGVMLLADADVNTTFWTMAWFAIIARVGMGFINPPLMAAALNALPPDQLNQSSGTINFFRQLGGACGVNFLVVFLEIRTQFHSESLAVTQTAANSSTRELLDQVERLLAADGIPEAMRPALALNHLGKMVEAQANTMGFQDGFLLIAAVFICALLPAWILGRAQRSNSGRGAASAPQTNR
ncbi:MAG: DHA2 family efflux MFS transporter permease subunit [Alphaproteobacteria bacterium]|nr:DHA2 family efflux MFS transporter permease subunit [Alphaproteobacteria bacterium]